jgi:hypothetical protein
MYLLQKGVQHMKIKKYKHGSGSEGMTYNFFAYIILLFTVNSILM